MSLRSPFTGAVTRFKVALGRAADARVMASLVAVVVLVVIWAAAIILIRSEYASERQQAASSVVDLAQTYEAHVLRTLREIEQTLKLVEFAHQTGREGEALARLDERDLLPPAMLFTVSTADRHGEILRSTNGLADLDLTLREHLRQEGVETGFGISPPRMEDDSSDWLLHFSRPITGPDGSLTGFAVVSVEPGFFVSNYEPATMGGNGVLGVVGADGIFRARQIGETISYGETVDYRSIMRIERESDEGAALVVNPWDDVTRYTVARELYGFPLAVVAGLSEKEQLQAAHASRARYLMQATGVSILVMVVLGLLGRLGRQLQLSRLKSMEDQLAHAEYVQYLAYHDALTGLPNRSMFSNLLGASIKQSQGSDRGLSVLFLDLDRFKAINDTLGHDAGDDLLKEVAARLKSALRESDTVARLGGDEFIVLLPEDTEPVELDAVCSRILASVRKPFHLAGQELRITVSIGVSTFPEDGEDEQTLMKNADVAMYNAKAEGKNNYKLYSRELDANSLERLALESELRRALEKDEFRLYYQARQSLRDQTVTGVEALLRWDHPDFGLIAPGQFLPLAEEIGLIIPIGRWVLETACRQGVAWRDQGLPPLSINVNLSAAEFSDENLLDDLEQIIERTGMDPTRLEIEVAENMLMSDLDRTLETIGKLREIGVRISIDHFGSGYSSFSSLGKFNLNTIKVDGVFIRDMATNPEDRKLVDAIIVMAKLLGLTVVAEGVETDEQAALLVERACDEIQGSYFSEPLLPESLPALLGIAHNGGSRSR